MQWYPHEAPQFLVAAGTTNGKVHLANFKVRCLTNRLKPAIWQ
jgi:hypothetical protein